MGALKQLPAPVSAHTKGNVHKDQSTGAHFELLSEASDLPVWRRKCLGKETK